MNITVFPKKLSGQVTVPPSKSVAHRMVIAAALSNGVSEITNLYPSVDILATMDCMRALGAKIDFDGDKAVIEGIKDIPESAFLDCCESGSTLRFLIPVACALGVDTQFTGRGRLPQRPITPYLDEFPKHGVSFEYNNTMPFSTNGKLTGGKFYVDGGISSQFITGLLFALPLLEEDSEIILTSHLESKPYVDITLGTLREHGCQVEETENGYFVKGGQNYMPFSGRVEGDYSQAAFFKVANSLGSDIDIAGLSEKSFQGDKKDKGAGGVGGKITPSAVLVIKNGTTRLVNIKNQDTMTKILDMVPDLVDKFSGKKDRVTEADVDDILDAAVKEEMK